MPYAEVNEIRMYFEETGKGTPIILLQGALGAIDSAKPDWSGVREQLSVLYKIVEIEHRGHGRTSKSESPLSYEAIASDLIEFIEQRRLAPVHIGGVSDGAIAALHIGMTRPDLVATLLCLGANYYNDDIVKEANKFFDVESIERLNGKAQEYSAIHDRNKYTGYWRELVKQLAENLAVNPSYQLEELAKISAPTLLMSGENDPYANRQQMIDMRGTIPNSEMLIVNNADHFVQHSHPRIIGPAILDFLRRRGEKG